MNDNGQVQIEAGLDVADQLVQRFQFYSQRRLILLLLIKSKTGSLLLLLVLLLIWAWPNLQSFQPELKLNEDVMVMPSARRAPPPAIKNQAVITDSDNFEQNIQTLLRELPTAAGNKLSLAGPVVRQPKKIAPGRSLKKRPQLPAILVQQVENPNLVKIKISSVAADKKTSRQARTLLAKHQPAVAESLLKKYLLLRPQAKHSSKALAELLLGQKRNAEFSRLLERSLALDKYNRLYLQAKQLQLQGSFSQALDVLVEQRPSFNGYSDYYRLQASLHHRLAQYSEAATIYHRLIQFNQYSPSYWLGLAMAMESLGQRHEALTALLKAEKFSHKKSSMHRFIQRRINQLASRQSVAQR